MDAEQQRSHYGYFLDLTTRWMDNDIYGHVNNVTYYSYFDTVANQYLIEHGDLDIHTAEVVGFVVASSCQYRSPIAFPEVLQGALRVEKLGRSSVQYELAIFKQEESLAAAYGTFTHVFVDRVSSRSVPIPARIRQALERLLIRA
ncbi:MAG: acyl-CoA thioesterase [Cellvibrionales bacterium]|nr:thioesterase family protein [Porticoccaceae bacterium]|tara:strand:+ start:1331 stop:1765 length:435 start_codon:yes stop_codon:yes gene_type:complete